MSADLFERIIIFLYIGGAGLTSLFCGFLAILIFRSRRGVKSDRWLAVVMGIFFLIAGYAVSRFFVSPFDGPYISAALWFFAMLAEIIAAVSLMEEMASVRAVRKAEDLAVSRLDPSISRNETASLRGSGLADRGEDLADRGDDFADRGDLAADRADRAIKRIEEAADQLDARTEAATDGRP